ncbi:MAG: sulfur carrier protein ThiS [Burkholderiaceae bacterium]
MSLTNQALAIAVNREVVPRAKWHERRFADGDRVDIVKAIGGG